jgi:putative membrane protein
VTSAARDPGLQPERTALAWQRSGLALALATIVVGRLTWGAVGFVAVVIVALGIGHAAVIFATAQRHYRIRTGTSQLKQWPTGVHAGLFGLQVVALGGLELYDVLRS